MERKVATMNLNSTNPIILNPSSLKINFLTMYMVIFGLIYISVLVTVGQFTRPVSLLAAL